ncbi:MAG: dATP/dGTP diphosphohydrolase domain-containing protein [Sulfuricurvum sp.]
MTEEDLNDLYEKGHLHVAPAKDTFVKADSNKNQLSLIDPLFITELGQVLTFGASKYSPNNWQLCSDSTRYKDALLRHLYAYLSGELTDPESGLPHTSAIAFNTMALRWFDRNSNENATNIK